MQLSSVISDKPSLAWYVAKPAELSDESVVEHVLSYGDWQDVQKLVSLGTKKNIANLFFKTLGKKRKNYSPQIAHFFSLYFRKNV